MMRKAIFELPHCPDALLSTTSGLLVGMYELIDGERTGGIVSVDLASGCQTVVLDKVGVLDLKKGIEDDEVLAACSDGKVRLLKGRETTEISVTNEKDMKGVVMAVESLGVRKATSITTAGELSAIDYAVGEQIWRVQAHNKEWESWIVASDQESIIATGSDDRFIKMFDLRSGENMFSRKYHESGVTWLAFEKDRNLFVSGSYDERMCFWDLRNLSAGPILTRKLNGGVWRAKRLPGNDRYLTAICYGGCSIYEGDDRTMSSGDQLGLCYGVDLIEDTIVALDFYAKSLSIF
jgi:WD40 repeat protein